MLIGAGDVTRTNATVVRETLRSPEVAFVLVTSPAPMSIQEVLYFSDRLVEAKMPRGAFVVNRMRQPPAHAAAALTADEVAEAIRAAGVKLDDDAPARLVTAHADATKL